MLDYDLIQGRWRLISHMMMGEHCHVPVTHYVFSGSSMKEIVPDLPDDGTLRTTFVLDSNKSPKRIVMTHDYNGPDGPPDPEPIIEHGFYSLEGDTLQICWGPEGKFPPRISSKDSLVTLHREA